MGGKSSGKGKLEICTFLSVSKLIFLIFSLISIAYVTFFATQRREQAKSSKELLSSILFTNSNFFHSLRSLSPFIRLNL